MQSQLQKSVLQAEARLKGAAAFVQGGEMIHLVAAKAIVTDAVQNSVWEIERSLRDRIETDELDLACLVAARFAASHPDGSRDDESCIRALDLIETMKNMLSEKREREEA